LKALTASDARPVLALAQREAQALEGEEGFNVLGVCIVME
jgi:hypothetical protein